MPIGPANKMMTALTMRLRGYAAAAKNPIGSETMVATNKLIVIVNADQFTS